MEKLKVATHLPYGAESSVTELLSVAVFGWHGTPNAPNSRDISVFQRVRRLRGARRRLCGAWL